MTEPILLEVSGLSKSFDQVKAVSGVSFQIRKGQVVGLIGANGAGKTTTMRMLATLELADSGSILINGINAVDHPNEVRPLIGWMPDYFHPYKTPASGNTWTSSPGHTTFRAAACFSPWMKCWTLRNWENCKRGSSTSSPRGRPSACAWRAPWSAIPNSSFWTNPPPGWTQRRAWNSKTWCICSRPGEKPCSSAPTSSPNWGKCATP